MQDFKWQETETARLMKRAIAMFLDVVVERDYYYRMHGLDIMGERFKDPHTRTWWYRVQLYLPEPLAEFRVEARYDGLNRRRVHLCLYMPYDEFSCSDGLIATATVNFTDDDGLQFQYFQASEILMGHWGFSPVGIEENDYVEDAIEINGTPIRLVAADFLDILNR